MQFPRPSAQPQQNHTEMYLKRGTESLQQGDYLQALLDFNEVITADAPPPQRSKAYAGRSAAFLALGNYRKAIEEDTHRIELDAGDAAEAYIHRGRIHLELGERAKAQDDAEEVIRLDDKLAPAYFVRGMCKFQTGDYTEAEHDLSRFVDASSTDDRLRGEDVRIAQLLIEECKAKTTRRPTSSEPVGMVKVGNVTYIPDPNVFSRQIHETPRLYKAGEYIKDRYLVVRVMTGGMGVVYVVDDVYKGERYAIKSYRPQFFHNERIRARFEKEARIWIALDRHPNIVHAGNFERINGNPFIFLEYVDGSDLSELIHEKTRLPVKPALLLMLQICAGMVYVSEQHQIVHRDLKPANVLLTKQGLVKITDFGLVRALDDERGRAVMTQTIGGLIAELTQGGLGTLHYMAPEQFESAHDADVTVDIYAAGIMLYEMLTGQVPFQGATLEEFKHLHSQAPVPPLPDLGDPGVTSKLNAIIGLCLKKKHADRYPSFTALHRELSELARPILGFSYDLETPDAPSVIELNDKAAYLSNLGEYEQALACFDEAIRLDPTFHIAYANKANLFTRLKRLEEAEECYRTVLQLQPSFHLARVNYADVLIALGRPEDALIQAEIVIDSWPDSPIGWVCKAQSLRDLKRVQEALDFFDRALERKNGPIPEQVHRADLLAGVYYNRGNCFRILGNNQRALESYQTSLSIRKESPACWLNLGNTLGNLNRNAEAIEAYDQALAFYPTYEKAFVNKANACRRLDRIDMAIDCLNKALQINPDSMQTLSRQGEILFEQGLYERALSIYTRMTQVNPDDPVGWGGRVLCFEKLGNETAAMESRLMFKSCQPPTNPENNAPVQMMVLRPDPQSETRAILSAIPGTPSCHYCRRELPGKPTAEMEVILNRAAQERIVNESFLVPRVCLKCKIVVCHQCAYEAAQKIGAREYTCPSCYGRLST